MFYIHQYSCISPQKTFGEIDIETLNESSENKLTAVEPVPEGIPPGILRRMGKAVRMGISSAMPIIKQASSIDGIITGTSNGGMEDCIKFLNQIIDYEEGMLTPANFVQSTPNAVAGQLGLLTKNKCYNITHVHRGLAFENALLDAAMQVKENPGSNFLVGGVEEISTYNFNIELLGGWYKKENTSSKNLYKDDSPGSIAGEGAAMFLANDDPENAVAEVKALKLIHSNDEIKIKDEIGRLIKKYGAPDLFISGENGDNRLNKYYQTSEEALPGNTGVIRYKHMSGEYPTASLMAFWLACHLLADPIIPGHMIKKPLTGTKDFQNILIYNTCKGVQHSLLLVSKK
jgi:Beta-ketoacyl synthase, N-terminal domain